MNEIVMIPIEKLIHHPNNPRKNLGDLTELTESIREQGIMQNLTVVPMLKEVTPETEDYQKYKVLIGNRRFEAAKAAGLTELPCAVVYMDFREQMATMLAENMQRSDLTIAEQAEGIQIMMDMGLDEAEVSKRTGLSRTTVGRRIKLAQLPKDDVEAAQQRGVTIMDMLSLMEIRDEKTREEILRRDEPGDKIRMAIRSASMEQETQDKMEAVRKRLEEFATEMKTENRWSDRYKREGSWTLEEALEKDELEPEDAKSVPYFYFISRWSVELWCTKAAKEEEDGTDEKEEERKKKREMLAQLFRTADAMTMSAQEKRKEFVRNIGITEKMDRIIRETWLMAVMKGKGIRVVVSFEDMDEFLGTEEPQEGKEDWDRWDTMTEKGIPETKIILAMLGSGLLIDESCRNGFVLNNGTWYENIKLVSWYALLEKIGYQMDRDEMRLMDGTHPILKEMEALKDGL